jgi:putative glutamine amidotransferase
MSRGPVIGVAFPREDYVAALEQAGAVVRVLSPSTDVLPDVLRELDGVMLTGGPDVRPALYGAASEHPTVEIDDVRDAYELPLAKAAIDTGTPLLAICRGVQVLNVAAGGTLVQDLPSERPSGLNHSITEPRDAIAHDVHVEPTSQLARVMAERLTPDGRLDVNSRHHQAIDRVAEGFAVSATAPDGTIEAIEVISAAKATEPRPFCLGVQWHPESFYRTGESAPLFSSFVEAARSKTTTHST